ncbi:MAG: type II toxin-antitoxin system YafQ family toxin [Coxiellaceae bacterium]|nr:type II toxin-antitoxin system YafQ family toxin [Coxiellaceae bacterium]
MRTVKYTSQFKKDYKREKKSTTHKNLFKKRLLTTVNLLATDKPLSKRYCDHALTGNWKDCRDCHIRPDLILIYRKPALKMCKAI